MKDDPIRAALAAEIKNDLVAAVRRSAATCRLAVAIDPHRVNVVARYLAGASPAAAVERAAKEAGDA